MNWLSLILLAAAFGAFLQPANGSAGMKNMPFQNNDLLEYFLENMIYTLSNNQILKSGQEPDVRRSFRELLDGNQGKKVSKIKHTLASRIAEIIIESIEGRENIDYHLENAIQAVASAFQGTIGIVDENFIETIQDMVSIMYNNNRNTVSQSTQLSQVASVNYQTIQSSISSILQSSSAFGYVSTGLLSSGVLIGAVVTGLSSYGVQSGIAQIIASQCLFSLGVAAVSVSAASAASASSIAQTVASALLQSSSFQSVVTAVNRTGGT